ncbi:MAG: CDP-alcohol phosphatidyltransferase family protein, partial [Desulfosudaceae bacterium]
RLARFNTHVDTSDNNYFTGLPIPAGAGMLAALVLLLFRLEVSAQSLPFLIYLVPASMYALSFLMVSSVPYASFKKMPALLIRAKNFNLLVISVLSLVVLIQEPILSAFVVILLYTFSGPIGAIRRFAFGHHQNHAAESESHTPRT